MQVDHEDSEPMSSDPLTLPIAFPLAVTTWNIQSLFAEKDDRASQKRRMVTKLLRNCDVLCLQETRADDAHAVAFGDLFRGSVVSFWSSLGRDAGGVCILIKLDFLKKYLPGAVFTRIELIQGRILGLKVVSHVGRLHIWNVHLHHQCKHTRVDQIRSLAGALRTNRDAMAAVWVGGDFNFVASSADRIHHGVDGFSIQPPDDEAADFRRILAEPHHLLEIEQNEHTRHGAGTTAKLDRLYSNHHPGEQLIYEFFSYVRLDTRGLSDHFPVSAGKRIPAGAGSHGRIPDWICRTREFMVAVRAEFKIRSILSQERTPWAKVGRWKKACQKIWK